jgi:hypothetical protein
MNRTISAVVTASALIFGVFPPREEAVAQTAKDLVGTWTPVSVTLEQDGKKADMTLKDLCLRERPRLWDFA